MASTAGVRKKRILSADKFFEGLIAALAAQGEKNISASQVQLHKAVRIVLREIEKQHYPEIDLSDVDYDPLYELSGWFDKFLARAQRDLLISFPNPSYSRIEIQLTQDEGKHLMSELGHEEALNDFSKLLMQELRA